MMSLALGGTAAIMLHSRGQSARAAAAAAREHSELERERAAARTGAEENTSSTAGDEEDGPVEEIPAEDLPFEDTYVRKAYCRDTPMWANGFDCVAEGKTAEEGCTDLGWTCAGYVLKGWCGGGQRTTGSWAFGSGVHHPELNCCECGGSFDAGGSCQQIGCGAEYSHDLTCQCNDACESHGNCCWDFKSFCKLDHAVKKGGYIPRDPRLLYPSKAPSYEFYVYRAQTTESFSPALSNVNAASLGAVVWYLHNEIVYKCPRRGTVFSKQDIVRIIRYKVTYKPTQPLYDRGISFGPFCAYDYASCTGPGNRHGEDWARFGFNMGCEYVGNWPHSGDFFQSAKAYPKAIWYSLPGYCPNEDFPHKTEKCAREEPGGYTGFKKNGGPPPTGAGNSTYTFEYAGEINIDDLVGLRERSGVESHQEFCRRGCKEFIVDWDRGTCGMNWWDHKWSKQRNQARVDQADEKFAEKYPNLPRDRDLQPPACDFDMSRFYSNHMPKPP
eukprot:TRINITY_DN47566_c0_g1_i1.p1 TRINITY_DN47566_c0_g1~~TRINITY_DN47566_c0_g1_i1.p1  ORF type:complete len:557 (-),score=96.86 TRINITY_DN47566_c0_g1_i1:94-1590(-)